MQKIQIINAHKSYRIKTGLLKNKVEHLLKTEGRKKGDVNIILSNNRYLKNLNKRFRKKNYATDVLSFPFNEPDFLGEIYISLEKVKKQSKKLKAAFYSELWCLITHGLFHLLGFTHKTHRNRALMEKKEAKYL